ARSLSYLIATPATMIYPLSLHDALPISSLRGDDRARAIVRALDRQLKLRRVVFTGGTSSGKTMIIRKLRELGHEVVEEAAELVRSEEHTSELQSLTNVVCRLLLEQKPIP